MTANNEQMIDGLTYAELLGLLGRANRATIEAIKAEIRLAGLITEPQPAVPPPCSPDDEDMVIAALLEGQGSWVGELDAEAFFCPFRRWAFVRLREQPDLTAENLAAIEPCYAHEIEQIAKLPMRHGAAIKDAADHVRELHRARRLGQKMKSIVTAMWMGTMTVDHALRVVGGMRSIHAPADVRDGGGR